jgi:hypothetical protein
LNNNGGNKTVVIQAWKEEDYPNYWNCNASGTSSENKGPKAADLRKNGTGPLPFLNIAFDVATKTVINTYGPDGTVTLGSGYTVTTTGIPDVDGYITLSLTNLTVVVPNQDCSEGVTIRADVWSSQGNINSGWTPHCVICNNRYAFNYPEVTAIQGCQIIGGVVQRTYEFIVDNINTDQSVSVTWEVFRDANGNNAYDAGVDVKVAESIAPTVLASGQQLQQGPTAYAGNTGPTRDDFIFVVVKTEGLENPQIETGAQFTCGTLPVTLRNFNAVMRSGKVNLTWETLLEENNDGFEIERRIGNGQYQKIGFVDSKAPNGNGAAYSYNFDDNLTLPKGVTYYRLRQLDLDGRATYSEVKAVRAGNSQLVISIYPNPNRGTANVAIPESAGKMDVSLDDYTGKSIQRWSGINVRNLQINNMKPGIYMLRINMRETGEVITERIVVQ